MQLSASAGSRPFPTDPTCSPVPNSSDDYQSTAVESDPGKPTRFDDLLSGDPEKPKDNAPARPRGRAGAGDKALFKSTAEFLKAPSADPATAPDLAAMLAFLAAPALTPETPPISVPEFDGGLQPGVSADSSIVATSAFEFEGSDRAGFTPESAPGPMTNVKAFVPVAASLPAAAQESLAATVAPTVSAASATQVLSAAEIVDPSSAGTPASTDVRDLAGAQGEGRAFKIAAGNRAGANIAAPVAVSSEFEKTFGKITPRNFLTPKQEVVTREDGELGIDVAKPPVIMATALFSQPQSALADTVASAAAIASPTDTAPVISTHTLAETARVTQGAVEAVLSAAERVTAERSSVTLQFSLGGNELAVSVNFRGDTVHTTFRTDSPELRAALSHEWAAAGSKMSDASVRMAPPVFTSSDAGTSTSSFGQQAQQQHQQRESAGRPASEGFSLNSLRSFRPDSAAAPQSVSSAPRQKTSTALHLHTFA